MRKALRKSIMLRTQLRNKLNKDYSLENWKAYKKQRSKCVKILLQVKASYYGNLDIISAIYNKKFWRTVKPLFTDKVQTTPSITLVETEKLMTDETALAEIFSEFFTNIIDTVDAIPGEFIPRTTGQLMNSIKIATEKYRHNPSILKIKDRVDNASSFEFGLVTVTAINKELSRLNPKKHLLVIVFVRGY